jgi:hypothetical protein
MCAQLGAEKLKLKKKRKSDLIWVEYTRELRETYMDFDLDTNTMHFLDSEKQSIVHSLITAPDGAGLNENRYFYRDNVLRVGYTTLSYDEDENDDDCHVSVAISW